MPDTRALMRRRLWAARLGGVVAALLAACASALAAEPATRLVFTGDVMLSREVQREIILRRDASPWSGMGDFFRGADWLMGNLEGAVGAREDCVARGPSPCFNTRRESLNFLRSTGFTAMSVENNHSADLGAAGRDRTRAALAQDGMAAIDFAHSPGFVKINGRVFAFISLSNVPGQDGRRVGIPSNELRQKIRLAKSLADWVIVNVHWGTELADWPQESQRATARWMIEQGADVIIGHHPHVVQRPECILGKPVFFSLGNHVFDQKYAETKRGLIADCSVHGERLSCVGVPTVTPMNSSFPEAAVANAEENRRIARCSVARRAPLVVSGYAIRPRLADRRFVDGDIVLEGSKPGARKWDAVARRMLAIEKGRLEKPGADELLFTLERHLSPIDRELSPRPYVYEVTAHGLVAKWRGTALAWPLVDARLIPAGGMDYLCALHRKDSFLELDPGTAETRTMVYRWNGFGFSGLDRVNLVSACRRTFK